jgi:hypothetical protein
MNLSFGCRREQKKFIDSLARSEIDLSPHTISSFSTDVIKKSMPNEGDGILQASNNNDVDNTTNFKTMLQVHLFDRILKLNANKKFTLELN